jgi:hypothetical protein
MVWYLNKHRDSFAFTCTFTFFRLIMYLNILFCNLLWQLQITHFLVN